jgi:hypothetical protein
LGLRPNEHGAYDFVALKPIRANDEIVWDYESTEYEFGFECSCGAPNCRGDLKGFRHHGDAVLGSYGKEYVAPYLFSGPPKEATKSDVAA